MKKFKVFVKFEDFLVIPSQLVKMVIDIRNTFTKLVCWIFESLLNVFHGTFLFVNRESPNHTLPLNTRGLNIKLFLGPIKQSLCKNRFRVLICLNKVKGPNRGLS